MMGDGDMTENRATAEADMAREMETERGLRHDRRAALHISADIGARGESAAVTLQRAALFEQFIATGAASTPAAHGFDALVEAERAQAEAAHADAAAAARNVERARKLKNENDYHAGLISEADYKATRAGFTRSPSASGTRDSSPEAGSSSPA